MQPEGNSPMLSPPPQARRHSSNTSHKSVLSNYAVRESTHLIPTPIERPPRFTPWSLELYTLAAISIITIGLGIALEVGLMLSKKKRGFHVPEHNAIAFASPSFLLSFFPTLLVIPLAFVWREMDFMIRWYHPYVILSRGHATGSESLLLDYTSGLLRTVRFSIKHRHTVIFFSVIGAIGTFLFQPLAGSIFELQQLPENSTTLVTGTRTIGLLPNVAQLNAFVAAAGYAEAAAYHGLSDPPFVMNGWASAEFDIPQRSSVNGSLSVATAGIQTAHNCANPSLPPTVQQTGNNAQNFTISSTSVSGCSVTATFDSTVAEAQAGVVNAPCGTGLDPEFQPVMFWFFHMKDDSTPEARTVFCAPTIKPFEVQLAMNLTNNNISQVTSLGDYTTTNNVTSDPLNGKAYNAIIFSQTNNTLITARALAISTAIPGAIFRTAQNTKGGGLQSVFDDTNGFLSITSQIYRQHLSVSAKSIYFLPAEIPLAATFTTTRPRLWIDPLAGHVLAGILFVIGATGIIVQLMHRKMRQNLYLTTPPGTMAGVLSLTSRSGFGELLLPYDDRKTLKAKLSGLRFGLDKRTGAIIADEYADIPMMSNGRDEAMASLLGRSRLSRIGEEETSSSRIASQYASEVYPPLTPQRTP